MPIKKKDERKFCNVALLPEDHERLRALAEDEQRTTTRQLSVIIRKEFAKAKDSDKVLA